MTRLRQLLPCLSILLAVGCRDLPVAVPDVMTENPGASASISVSPGFYFLPPMVPNAGPFSGTFDPSRTLTVKVVCTGATGAACPTVVTLDANSKPPGQLRVDLTEQAYVTNWLKTDVLSAGRDLYRIEVYEQGSLLGRADLWVVSRQQDMKSVTAGYVGLVRGNPLLIKFRVETNVAPPLPPPTCTSCLEVLPSTILLRGAGDQQTLKAYLVDAGGIRTPVTPAWTSTNLAAVTVSAAGVATGAAATGSSQITAAANGRTSAPVLALVASPVDGALLITDSQVEGAITPVDPNAPYGLGWRYRVRLRGVSAAVGQIVMTTGSLPVGGKVVTVTPAGTGLVDVVLEVVPLTAMFTALTVSQKMSLNAASFTVAPSVQQTFAVRRRGNRLDFTAPNGRVQIPSSDVLAMADPGVVEFDIGPFGCEAAVGIGANFPILLTVSSFSVSPSISFDILITDMVPERIIADGTMDVQFAAKPVISGAVTGEISCKVVPANLVLPIGGPLSFFIGGIVPLGVGFGAEVETSVGGIGFDIALGGTVTTRFGFDCTASCIMIGEGSTTASALFQPVVPALGNGVQVGLAEKAFGYAELKIGSVAVPDIVKLTLLKATIGLKQSADLAGREFQRADPTYASTLDLKPTIDIKSGLSLSLLSSLLTITLADFSYKPDLPTISTSPAGTFSISPPSVGAGDNTSLGDSATFTVNLSSVTYLGAYAVESVEILWYKDNGGGNFALQAGRPGCTSLAASTGQTQFTCKTDFVEADTGSQKFYAFVKARIAGTSIPVLLEIANDAKATLQVTPVKVTVQPDSIALPTNGQWQFTANVTGTTNKNVIWSATGGTVTQTGLYTAGTNNGSFHVIATSEAFPGKADTAKVQVGPCAQPPCVVVTPSSSTVNVGQGHLFIAKVNGVATNAVVWTATGGGITGAGVFAAGSPGNYTITATSIANPSEKGSATVNVVNAGTVLIAPTSAQVRFGASRQFGASGTVAPFTWSTDPGAGSISASGLFTAGNVEGEYSIMAQGSSGSGTAVSRVFVDGILGNYSNTYLRTFPVSPFLSVIRNINISRVFNTNQVCLGQGLACYSIQETDLGTINIGQCFFTQDSPGASTFTGSCAQTSSSLGGTLKLAVGTGIITGTLQGFISGVLTEAWAFSLAQR